METGEHKPHSIPPTHGEEEPPLISSSGQTHPAKWEVCEPGNMPSWSPFFFFWAIHKVLSTPTFSTQLTSN